jgi:hypothetical protein
MARGSASPTGTEFSLKNTASRSRGFGLPSRGVTGTKSFAPNWKQSVGSRRKAECRKRSPPRNRSCVPTRSLGSHRLVDLIALRSKAGCDRFQRDLVPAGHRTTRAFRAAGSLAIAVRRWLARYLVAVAPTILRRARSAPPEKTPQAPSGSRGIECPRRPSGALAD